MTGYLANVTGPVPLVLDLHIVHERFGSSSDPSINGHLHYPNDVDRSLNETAADKIRKYRTDYNNYKIVGKLTVFFHLQEFNLGIQAVDSGFPLPPRSVLLSTEIKGCQYSC